MMDNKPESASEHDPQKLIALSVLSAWHAYRDYLDTLPGSIDNLGETVFELPYVEQPHHYQMGRTGPDLLLNPDISILVQHTIDDDQERLAIQIVSNREENMREPLDQLTITADLSNKITDVDSRKHPLNYYFGLLDSALLWKKRHDS